MHVGRPCDRWKGRIEAAATIGKFYRASHPPNLAMPRHKPASRTSAQFARRAVASLAARLMAEDGIDDYGYAKRKAARSLGFGDNEALPGNDEVEAELRAYQAIYQEDEQRDRLRELRAAALDVMAQMADFRPYLTGAVLDGTAGRYARIEIDIFADSAKDVEIFLLSRNQPYETSEPRHAGPDTPETRVHLDWNGIPVQLAVFALHQERSNRRGGGSGRARAEAVTALLEQE